jgi:tetratricopeptide (TPR) repeat protein
MNPTERAKLTLRVAEAERSGGRLDAARATLEGIVDDVPKTEEAAEAQFRIGLIYEKDLRKYDDAMSAFEQVREISPGAEATRAAGEERQKILELQRIQGTLAELDSTRVIERAQSHFEIAEVLLLRMDDPEGALEHYRAAQAEDPPGDYGPRALLSASWVLEHDLERTDEAVEVLSELAAKYPASPQAERARSLLVEKGESIPDPDPIPMRRDEEPPKEEEGPAEQQPAEGGGDTTLEPAASDG